MCYNIWKMEPSAIDLYSVSKACTCSFTCDMNTDYDIELPPRICQCITGMMVII